MVLTGINMFSWSFPLRQKNFHQNANLLGLANAFAGGIFMMLAFGHMLPESVEILESIGADKNLAFQFTLVGYMFVFFVEKIAFDAHAIMHAAMDSETGHTGQYHHGVQHLVHMPQATSTSTVPVAYPSAVSIATPATAVAAPPAAAAHDSSVAHTEAVHGAASIPKDDHLNAHTPSAAADTSTGVHAHTPSAFTSTSISTSSPNAPLTSSVPESNPIAGIPEESRGTLSTKSAIVLLLAMSLHRYDDVINFYHIDSYEY
jgi:zinc transporter ZupT